MTKTTGTLVVFKLSIINLSPGPIPVEASITNKITSTSFVNEYDSLFKILPNLPCGL